MANPWHSAKAESARKRLVAFLEQQNDIKEKHQQKALWHLMAAKRLVTIFPNMGNMRLNATARLDAKRPRQDVAEGKTDGVRETETPYENVDEQYLIQN